MKRVAFVFLQHRKAGRRGHFDQRHAVRRHAVEAFDLAAERIEHAHGDFFAADRDQKRVDRALAAVCHGDFINLCIGDCGQHAALDGLGDLDGTQAALVRIRCDQNFHKMANLPR